MCDEKEGSGGQIPMSINMPQLIFQRAECPLQMSQAALSCGQYLGGGGGGGGIPGFPPV